METILILNNIIIKYVIDLLNTKRLSGKVTPYESYYFIFRIKSLYKESDILDHVRFYHPLLNLTRLRFVILD